MDEKNKSKKYFMERLWDFRTDTERTQRILFLKKKKKETGEQPGSDRLQNDRRSGKGKQ